MCLSVCVGTKYCPLLESEGGLSLLQPIADNSNARFYQVQKLAQQIVHRCRQFRLSAESRSTDDVSSGPTDECQCDNNVNNVDNMTDDSEGDDDMDDDNEEAMENDSDGSWPDD